MRIRSLVARPPAPPCRRHLIPFLTARANLLVVDEFGGRDWMGRRAERQRADGHIDELLLADRAAIGRAFMNEPGLVLFDEPTSAIIVTRDARITHDADRTVHIEDGRISDDWAST